jgi:hypothetical protein
MGKKFGSGMNNQDHNSESLKNNFWIKILKFFDVDPGSGMEKSDPERKKVGSGLRDKLPGSATLINSTVREYNTISKSFDKDVVD